MRYYSKADGSLWKGREVDPDLGPQYWYQVVEFSDLSEAAEGLDFSGANVLLGYAVEEGVKRNQGRVGAAAGPDTTRPHLGRLANHLRGRRIIDAGNVVCPDGNLEASHGELSRRVEQICRAGGKPILIGGGHDMAYGHFRGLHRAYHAPGKKFGLINLDAHLDLRSPQNGPTSGTPFHEIMEEMGSATSYLAIGIQRAANPPELYATAEKFGVRILSAAEFKRDNTAVATEVKRFVSEVDHLYVTVDTDCFSAGIAPGVSAPNPIGLDVAAVLELLTDLYRTGKVVGWDVAEFNPKYDRDGITARLVSRVIAAMIVGD